MHTYFTPWVVSTFTGLQSLIINHTFEYILMQNFSLSIRSFLCALQNHRIMYYGYLPYIIWHWSTYTQCDPSRHVVNPTTTNKGEIGGVLFYTKNCGFFKKTFIHVRFSLSSPHRRRRRKSALTDGVEIQKVNKNIYDCSLNLIII